MAFTVGFRGSIVLLSGGELVLLPVGGAFMAPGGTFTCFPGVEA